MRDVDPDDKVSGLMNRQRRDQRTPLSEDYLREHTVDELRPLSGPIRLVNYDSEWPHMFEREAERIRAALGSRALRIEHVGSTSVPELPAKPTIDIVLVVARVRQRTAVRAGSGDSGLSPSSPEPGWYEHRMFQGLRTV